MDQHEGSAPHDETLSKEGFRRTGKLRSVKRHHLGIAIGEVM
jgi:hypothetical protein